MYGMRQAVSPIAPAAAAADVFLLTKVLWRNENRVLFTQSDSLLFPVAPQKMEFPWKKARKDSGGGGGSALKVCARTTVRMDR